MPPAQRWNPSDLTGARLAVYLRASDDQDNTESSVTAQEGVGLKWAASRSIGSVTTYCDNDLSASLFAAKPRPDFDRLIGDVSAGQVDLIWMWKLNRSQRTLAAYVQLRDLCRAKGVGWVIKNRVYDLTDPSDLRVLGNDAVNGEIFSLELSENVRLGVQLAASQGKPHAPPTYGFRRIYDGRGRYVKQVPDDALREAVAADGSSFWWSPAAVVIEIITRVAQGHTIIQIARDLTARAIPSPKGRPAWARTTVRNIAENKAYIGIRVHAPEDGERTETPEAWPTIVGDTAAEAEAFVETFYKAQAVLGNPARRTTKPGRALHLCSYIVACAKCDSTVSSKVDRKNQRKDRGAEGRRMYACLPNRCVGIGADELDEFVMTVVDAYLAREDVRAHLAASAADDLVAVSARAEVSRLNVELETWRRLGEAGEDALTVMRSIKGIKASIAEHERIAAEASTSPLLRASRIDWENLPVARQSLAALADIRLRPVGKGRRHVPMEERVSWRWLLGPDA